MGIASTELSEKTRIFVSTSGIADFIATDPAVARNYCGLLAGALESRLTFYRPDLGDSAVQILTAARGCDLALFFDPGLSTLEDVLFGAAFKKATGRAPAAAVVVHQLRWPPEEILLAVRIETGEAMAVIWAARLARAFDAGLTILPLVPCQSGIYHWGCHQEGGIESVLAPGMPSGETLRALLQPIRSWPIRGTLRMRHGDPGEQVSLEVARGDYDLIVIGRGRAKR